MTHPIHPILERVATSICYELENEGQYVPDWLRLRLARAAIQALLEPDEGMVGAGKAAGGEAYEYSQFGVIVCPPEKAFRAMLLPLVEGEYSSPLDTEEVDRPFTEFDQFEAGDASHIPEGDDR